MPLEKVLTITNIEGPAGEYELLVNDNEEVICFKKHTDGLIGFKLSKDEWEELKDFIDYQYKILALKEITTNNYGRR